MQDSQWVENTAGGQYVFGRLDQTTVEWTTRVNYTITPQLSVQIYAAPFVSAGDYERFKQLVKERTGKEFPNIIPRLSFATKSVVKFRNVFCAHDQK